MLSDDSPTFDEFCRRYIFIKVFSQFESSVQFVTGHVRSMFGLAYLVLTSTNWLFNGCINIDYIIRQHDCSTVLHVGMINAFACI